nr:MAG TPA: hypothetical protein [Crassvirales sp.]
MPILTRILKNNLVVKLLAQDYIKYKHFFRLSIINLYRRF